MALGVFVRRNLRKPLRTFGVSEYADTHAQPPVERPLGKPLEAKLLKEPIRSSGSTDDALEEAGQAEQHIITDAAPNDFKLGEGA